MLNKTSVVMAVLLVGTIAGCGGSGGSTPTTSISGKVADGYLVGATVFLDKNSNYNMDAGEPTATTDANGAYTLVMDPADVGNYPIVALATKGVTIDKDTNMEVANSYLLSMPKDSISGTVNSNFISPMSTQLREIMETGKYATVQAAMNALRSQMGLPAGTNMMADYMADQANPNYQTMHTAAQNMATLMGGQMALVMVGSTAVDVNRYRNMMGTIFSNMSSLTGANSQTAMTNLMGTMSMNLPNIQPGQPFMNMSSAFRGGMTGVTGSGAGGMM